MSIHRSLVAEGGSRRHRNVLSREERIAKLEDEGRWDETASVYGLPKVRSIKASTGKKKVKKEEAAVEGAGVEGAPAEGEAAPAEDAKE